MIRKIFNTIIIIVIIVKWIIVGFLPIYMAISTGDNTYLLYYITYVAVIPVTSVITVLLLELMKD